MKSLTLVIPNLSTDWVKNSVTESEIRFFESRRASFLKSSIAHFSSGLELILLVISHLNKIKKTLSSVTLENAILSIRSLKEKSLIQQLRR
jgi:hypothetical protein